MPHIVPLADLGLGYLSHTSIILSGSLIYAKLVSMSMTLNVYNETAEQKESAMSLWLK